MHAHCYPCGGWNDTVGAWTPPADEPCIAIPHPPLVWNAVLSFLLTLMIPCIAPSFPRPDISVSGFLCVSILRIEPPDRHLYSRGLYVFLTIPSIAPSSQLPLFQVTVYISRDYCSSLTPRIEDQCRLIKCMQWIRVHIKNKLTSY